jgi:hypothetical protein
MSYFHFLSKLKFTGIMNTSLTCCALSTHDQALRQEIIEGGMESKVKYFLQGGRKLSSDFLLMLYRKNVIIEQEYLDFGVLSKAKKTVKQEDLTKIEAYEQSIYARIETQLLRLFPDLKKPDPYP